MKLGLGLGLGGGNGQRRWVTDYFNGLALSGTTVSSGTVVVSDYNGKLVTSPANTPAVEGMRLTDGAWLDTDLNGDPIHPSTALRTRKGTGKKYDEGHTGLYVSGAITNKVTCRKANPVDTTNLATSAATATIVDYATELLNAGLSKVCTDGKAYKFDIANGGYVVFLGVTGNGNAHSISLYLATDGEVALSINGSGGTGAVLTSSTSLTRVVSNNIVPASSTKQLGLFNNSGGARTVYAILPNLQEGSVATEGQYLDSTGADPLTALTRPAINVTRPTEGTALARGNDFAIYGRVVPEAGGQSKTLFSSYLDTTHYFEVYTLSGTTVSIRKAIGGSNIYQDKSYTQVAGTPFEYLAYNHSVHGMGVAVKQDGGSWSVFSENTDGQSVTLPATYQIGAGSNARHFNANYPFTEIIELPVNQQPQAWLMDQLAKGRI